MGKFIVFTTETFEKAYEQVKKKYKNIDNDFDNFLADIEENENLGTSVTGVRSSGNKIFKKRMKNSSAKKGLSGGFRIIECLITSENEVYLLDIYSKSDKENMINSEIEELLKKNLF